MYIRFGLCLFLIFPGTSEVHETERTFVCFPFWGSSNLCDNESTKTRPQICSRISLEDITTARQVSPVVSWSRWSKMLVVTYSSDRTWPNLWVRKSQLGKIRSELVFWGCVACHRILGTFVVLHRGHNMRPVLVPVRELKGCCPDDKGQWHSCCSCLE